MSLAGGEMERAGCLNSLDERRKIQAVVIWKRRWSWWYGSYCEGGTV